MSEKRKSKAQLAAERLVQERKAKAKADAANSKGKKKEKKPTRCKVMPCRCVGASVLTYKTGAKQHGRVDDFFPFHTRNAGAERQDKLLGRGNRFHNPGFVKGKLVTWTCTVCGEKKRV